MNYERLLEETLEDSNNAPPVNSLEEEKALNRFKDFFANMSPQAVRDQIDSVYAENAILYDTIVLHRGINHIKPYFIKTTERAAGVRVKILETIRHGNDFYIKWIMDIEWSAFKKGAITRSPGMSHLRFNSDGKVVLHFDFWDSATGFYEHIPIIGSLIRWIKRKASN